MLESKPLTAAAAVMLSACLALAGCGADDGGEADGTKAAPVTTTVATAASSESKFVAEAEAICAGANEKEAALGAPGVDWIHSEYFTDVDFLEDFNAIGRSALRKLRKLTPPEEDRVGYQKVLGSIAAMIRGLDKQIAGVRSGRDSGDAVEVYERGYSDLSVAGGPIGLKECLGILL
jgi:hypothetical protein